MDRVGDHPDDWRKAQWFSEFLNSCRIVPRCVYVINDVSFIRSDFKTLSGNVCKSIRECMSSDDILQSTFIYAFLNLELQVNDSVPRP